MTTIVSNKDKFILFSFLGVLFASLSFVSILVSNHYLWVTLLLNSYLAICFIFHDIIRTKSIITYGIVFNVMWWLYTNIYIIEMLIAGTNLGGIDYILVGLSVISMLSFNFVYYSSFYKKGFVKHVYKAIKTRKVKEYSFKRLNHLLFIILLTAILIQIYIIFYKIGVNNYIFTSRSGRSLLLTSYRKYMFFEDLLILVTVISYYLTTVYKTKLNSIVFYFAFLNSVITSVITISRTNFLMLILPILFIAAYKRRISNKKIIIILLAIFALFSIWKGLLSGFIFNQELKIDSGNFSGEFNTWYTIGNLVLGDLFDGNINYLYGKSFFDTIKNLVLPFTNVEPLSVWYVKNYEFETYMRGGGRGFSGIVEGFMNLSFLGNIFYFMILGSIFKKIEKIRYIDIKYLIIYSVSLPYIQRIFRSESYSLFKTWWWFYILVILVIFKISEVKEQKNGSERTTI